MFFLFRCLSRMPADSGLGEVYHLAFGSRWGKVCCGLSALWMVMIMVVDLRFYAERYVSAVYPEAGKLVFYLAMAVLQLWIVRGGSELFAARREGFLLGGHPHLGRGAPAGHWEDTPV